jgi:hypothetical protein
MIKLNSLIIINKMQNSNKTYSGSISFHENFSKKQASFFENFSNDSPKNIHNRLNKNKNENKKISLDFCLQSLDEIQKNLKENYLEYPVACALKYKFKNAIRKLKNSVEFGDINEGTGVPPPKSFLRNVKRLKLVKKIEKFAKVQKNKNYINKQKLRIKSDETQTKRIKSSPKKVEKKCLIETIEEENSDLDVFVTPMNCHLNPHKSINDDLIPNFKNLNIELNEKEEEKDSQWIQKNDTNLNCNLPGNYFPHQFRYNSPEPVTKNEKRCPDPPKLSNKLTFLEENLTKEDANFDFLTVQDNLWTQKMQKDQDDIDEFLQKIYKTKKSYIDKQIQNIYTDDTMNNSSQINAPEIELRAQTKLNNIYDKRGSFACLEILEKEKKKVSLESLFNKNFSSSDGSNRHSENRLLKKKMNHKFKFKTNCKVDNKIIMNPNLVLGYEESSAFNLFDSKKKENENFLDHSFSNKSDDLDDELEDMLKDPFAKSEKDIKNFFNNEESNASTPSIKDLGKFLVKRKLLNHKKTFF